MSGSESSADSTTSPPQKPKRTLAVGDIHGCMTALLAALNAAGVTDVDELILLGDLVDRGPDSDQVLQWAVDRTAVAPTLTLLGNHEAMMLEARECSAECEVWITVGGNETLMSYLPIDERPSLSETSAMLEPQRVKRAMERIPDEHWKFLKQMRLCVETETDLFVHGGLDSERAMSEQVVADLLWRRFDDASAHCSGKRVWCGHTPQRDYRPRALGNTFYESGQSHTVCLDTAAFAGGWLTIADVKTGAYWQGNQWGEDRSGWIEF